MFEHGRECNRPVTTALETTTGQYVLLDDRRIAGPGFVPLTPGHVSYVASFATAHPWHWTVCRATARDLNSPPYVVASGATVAPWIPPTMVRFAEPLRPVVNEHEIGTARLPLTASPRRRGPRGPFPRGFCDGCGKDRALFGGYCRRCVVTRRDAIIAAW
jgi:hypothetical protein